MARLLIAIKSCAYDRDRGAHDLVRDTWGKDVAGADLKFFTARTGNPDPDEVIVKAPDDYKGLPYKVREIVRWALAQKYDYIFLCDTGSFVIPHHLVNYGFQGLNYVGYCNLRCRPFKLEAEDSARGCPPIVIDPCYPWASGGGYILSRKAMGIVAASEPNVWAEDLWVGQLLIHRGIQFIDKFTDGYKGYVVDWIHDENNNLPDGMQKRSLWMWGQYERAKKICEVQGCESPLWDRNPRLPDDDEAFYSAQSEAELIIERRRRARASLSRQKINMEELARQEGIAVDELACRVLRGEYLVPRARSEFDASL